MNGGLRIESGQVTVGATFGERIYGPYAPGMGGVYADASIGVNWKWKVSAGAGNMPSIDYEGWDATINVGGTVENRTWRGGWNRRNAATEFSIRPAHKAEGSSDK